MMDRKRKVRPNTFNIRMFFPYQEEIDSFKCMSFSLFFLPIKRVTCLLLSFKGKNSDKEVNVFVSGGIDIED